MRYFGGAVGHRQDVYGSGSDMDDDRPTGDRAGFNLGDLPVESEEPEPVAGDELLIGTEDEEPSEDEGEGDEDEEEDEDEQVDPDAAYLGPEDGEPEEGNDDEEFEHTGFAAY